MISSTASIMVATTKTENPIKTPHRPKKEKWIIANKIPNINTTRSTYLYASEEVGPAFGVPSSASASETIHLRFKRHRTPPARTEQPVSGVVVFETEAGKSYIIEPSNTIDR